VHLAVDGWSLVDRPWSAEALHLTEWLGAVAGADPELRLSLVHPAGPLPALPEQVQTHPLEVDFTAWGRLHYEQRKLPGLSRALGADLLYVPRPAAALTSSVPVAALANAPAEPERVSPLERLRRAMGTAGAANAACRLCLSDLGVDPAGRGTERVPPFVADDLLPAEPATHPVSGPQGLASGYVLSCGPRPGLIPFLLAVWSWVEGSVGEAAPLVLLGVDPAAAQDIWEQARGVGVDSTLRILPPMQLGELPALYRGAAAFLSLGLEANGQPLRWALSCGVPVAGLGGPEPEAILGEAAYLVQPGDARRLGAACLTLLVEEQVAADLRRKGLARAEAYHGRAPLEAWLRVFRRATS
jgi:hypothetical protein